MIYLGESFCGQFSSDDEEEEEEEEEEDDEDFAHKVILPA